METTLTERISPQPCVALAGGTGDLGERIARALRDQGADVGALVRSDTSTTKRKMLEALGVRVVPVDFADADALRTACIGATCVVSALNGLRPVILNAQQQLLDAAVAAGVPRFIPSDFCLDFTRTRAGRNRNLDLRREFEAHIALTPIRATSILNGAFSDLLAGQAPIVVRKIKKVVFWGRAEQQLDFTSKDDVARYTAAAALDASAPRFLRIAGDVVTAGSLAQTMTSLTGTAFRPQRAGSIGLLSLLIRVVRTLTPPSDAVFPAWQGMQYVRDMFSGDGKLRALDNDRYGERTWTSARDVLVDASSS